MRTLALILMVSRLAVADEQPKHRIDVAKTEQAELPSGGTLRLMNSTGEVTVEGWDQPGVEITTVKSTKAEYTEAERAKATQELDRIRIGTERKGGDLVITTQFPKSRIFPPSYPLGGATDFYLSYRIKVPRNTRVVVANYAGEINFDGLTEDIHATSRQGSIILRLPEEGKYAIDAHSAVGNVVSDFPGTAQRRHWFGHDFRQSSSSPHTIFLRNRFGDILLLKIHQPAASASVAR